MLPPLTYLLLSLLCVTPITATHVQFTLSNHRLSSLTSANTHAYYESGRKMTVTWHKNEISSSVATTLEVTLRSSTNSVLKTLTEVGGMSNTGSVEWVVNYGSKCENCKLYFRTLNVDAQKSGYTAAFDLTTTTLPAISISSQTDVAANACSKIRIIQGATYNIQWTTFGMADQAMFDVALVKMSTSGQSGASSFDRYLNQRLSSRQTTFTIPDDLSTSDDDKYYVTVADSNNAKLYDACPSKHQWSVDPPEKTCDYSLRANHAWIKSDESVCKVSFTGGGAGASTKCGTGSSLVMVCKSGYTLDSTKTSNHCSSTTGHCIWTCNEKGIWSGGGPIQCVVDANKVDPTKEGKEEEKETQQDKWKHLLFWTCLGLGLVVVTVIVVALCSRCREKTGDGSVPTRSSSISSVQFAWAAVVSENNPAVAAAVAATPSAPPISPTPSRAGSIEMTSAAAGDLPANEEKFDVEAPPAHTDNPMWSHPPAENDGASGEEGCCESDCMFFLFLVSAFVLIPVWIAWLCYWRKDARIARAKRNVNLYTHVLNVFYILFFSITTAITGSNY